MLHRELDREELVAMLCIAVLGQEGCLDDLERLLSNGPEGSEDDDQRQ